MRSGLVHLVVVVNLLEGLDHILLAPTPGRRTLMLGPFMYLNSPLTTRVEGPGVTWAIIEHARYTENTVHQPWHASCTTYPLP